ncbi:MAG: hypothetical protein ABI675_14990 [Chitinophagaceae bacterium]
MKKYLLGSLAVVMAIAFSAFNSNLNQPVKSNINGKLLQQKWYVYVGTQDATERQVATNYTTPTTTKPTCVSTGNECAVKVNVPNGTPPTNPDFTNVTFNMSSGFPDGNQNGGSNFIENAQKQ